MIKNKFKLGFLGASLLISVAGCSSDDNIDNSASQDESGVISNAEMKLTYGSKLLSDYLSLKNSRITFNRFSDASQSQAVAQALKTVNNYQPDLTNAVALTGNQTYTINSGQKYYIPENTTFTGGINFNGAGTLIIIGNLGGSSNINVPNGGVVDVAPSGRIESTSNFHLNSGSTLNNYGNVSYNSQTVDGTVNNFNEMVFTKSLNLNGSSVVNNNCSMVFNGFTQLNAALNNSGFADFKAGFHINGSGNLVLATGSLTDISGGNITVDGKIKNTSNGFARVDISNAATIGNMNANPAFEGKIDINTTATINSSKINSDVTLNGNTFIAANSCTPQRGLAACDDSVLQFTLAATVQSPTVNGAILSATDVKVVNGNAYVSYHTNDEAYGDAPNGSVRIFNVQNQQAPSLTAQADFNNAEFNGIDVSGSKVYAVGGNKAGSRLMTTPLTSGTFNTSDLSVFTTHKLPSITGKNSFVHNNMLWLVAGATNGGFFKLDPSNGFAVTDQFYSQGARAKYVAQNGTYQAFFAVEGGGAYLRIANIDGTNPQEYRYPTLAQTVQDGKNVITMDDQYVYVALSDKGVAKFSLQNGSLVSHFVPNDYRVNGSKAFKNNGYTNGVAVNDCYLYIANGADGVIVLNKNTFNVVGHFTLAESANYVYANNGLLFVATGRNGLNIIKIN